MLLLDRQKQVSAACCAIVKPTSPATAIKVENGPILSVCESVKMG